MPFPLKLEKTKSETIQVALEPALNAFESLFLLAKEEYDAGIHDWVQQTRMQMSAEEFARHKLVVIGFFYAMRPSKNWTSKNWNSFEAYLNSLDQTPPSVFRDSLLNTYAEICLVDGEKIRQQQTVNWDEVLASPKNYVEFLRSRFGDELTDEEIETRAYQYVIDPAAMKQLITSHLRWFWKNHLEAEWTRTKPMLEESVRAFQHVDLGDMTRIDAARFITGKELEDLEWANHLEETENLVFIPNPHIGPYTHSIGIQNTTYIHFGARLPEGSDLHVPDLDRAEIVARLSALADDTRLKILRMLAEKDEMRSQDIIDETKLSQPTVSRYLIQLTAAGYLQERRKNGAKVYSLNRERIEKTLKAISAFLLG